MVFDVPSQMQKFRFVLLCVLLLLAMGIGIHLWKINAFNSRTQMGFSLESGLMISLLVLSVTDLTPEILRLVQRRTDRGRFIRFFGPAAVSDRVCLVFAHRSPRKDVDLFDEKRILEGAEHHPLGVTAWWALQDVRAAVYLSNMIHEMNGKDVWLTDTRQRPKDLPYCAISIGLVSNTFTELLGIVPRPWLFRTIPSAAFDAFSLRCDCPKPQDPDEDLAIVARIVPPKEVFHRVWFVCAGRTAAGTAAAGYFLAKNWQVLYDLYKEHGADLQTHSLAVAIKHRGSEKMEESLDHLDESGVLYCPVEKQPPLACWSPE